MTKRLLFIVASCFVVAVSAFAADTTATKTETWTGTIKAGTDAKNVEFVAGGNTYEVTGTTEANLLKEIGKNVELTGTMSADKKSIEASSFKPAIQKTAMEAAGHAMNAAHDATNTAHAAAGTMTK
jgi:hypothetical protein